MNYVIIVTWMDDRQETYRATNYKVIDGELVITENQSYARRDDHQHFPLANVRTWRVERP